MPSCFALSSLVAVLLFCVTNASAEEFFLIEFETRLLNDEYYSEGANAGDIDGDGQADVVCGPFWYRGPDFQTRYPIYEPVPQNRDRYADNFFSWVHDFDADGHPDVLAVGFPGTPAYVYRNPGVQPRGPEDKSNTSNAGWTKHQVLDWVSNESPQFTDIVGDSMEELVCTRDGFFGFATVNRDDPLGPWTFHPISEQIAPPRFGHGLGIGDINGDGRQDLLFSGGWFEQPSENPENRRWKLHEVSFSNAYGGAEMYAYDVDGDGDQDVLTSHAAHDFGLGWYEQVNSEGEIRFEHHLIMGDRPERNRYGLVVSELHSIALEDIDGDGLKDLVTGKTFWSHHRQSPMWDADPVVYWFRLVRGDDGTVDWVPQLAGKRSGIGRQLSVKDLNQDGLLDFVVGGMKGTHVLIQSRKPVDQAEWQRNQPEPFQPSDRRSDRGPAAQFDDGGKVVGAIEGEAMRVVESTGGTTSIQQMGGFQSDRWSGGAQLFWREGAPQSKLTLEFAVEETAEYEIGAVFTTARDYAMINLYLDDQAVAEKLDLYDYPDVRTSGVIPLGKQSLKQGTHRLQLETVGSNPSAIPAFMVGLDCLVLKRSSP